MRKRGPKNKIETLDKSLVEQIKEKLLNPNVDLKATLNFINNHPKINKEISASSLSRFAKVFDKEMQEIKDIKVLINNLPKEFNFDDDSKFHSALASMLSKILFEFVVKGDLTVKDLGVLSKSLENIMSSIKDREKLKIDLKNAIEKEIKQTQISQLKDAKDKGKITSKAFDEARAILGL